MHFFFQAYTNSGPWPGASFIDARIVRGQVPEHPGTRSRMLGLTEVLWNICLQCWKFDPSERPSMQQVRLAVKPHHPLSVDASFALSDDPHKDLMRRDLELIASDTSIPATDIANFALRFFQVASSDLSAFFRKKICKTRLSRLANWHSSRPRPKRA